MSVSNASAPPRAFPPASGTGAAPDAAAPSAPCVLHNGKHSNAECWEQHGSNALGAGGGKRSHKAGGGGPRKGGGGSGDGGRNVQSDRAAVAINSVTAIMSSPKNKPPRGQACGRGAR